LCVLYASLVMVVLFYSVFFFFQAEDGIRDFHVTGVQTCALPISGRFSLVPVSSVGDFQQKIFGPEVVTNSEEIFYMKYSRIPGQGNYILWILNHPSTGLFNYGGAYAHYGDASNPFYVEWDDADIRKHLWDQVDFGLGPNTLVSSKYTDQQAVEQNKGAG